jgi:hypothetical protein
MRDPSPQDWWGILDKARMHKYTYEAYKDKIKVEIMLL